PDLVDRASGETMRRPAAFAVVLSFLVLPGGAAAAGPARLLKDINLGHNIVGPVPGRNDSSRPSYVATAIGPDGRARALYFASDGSTNDASQWDLWATDGTPRGTTRIKKLFSWVSGGDLGSVLDGIAYFGADDGVYGQELWRSDGTTAGTWMVKDL